MIVDVDDLYFRWLVNRMDNPSEALARLCWMLHKNVFQRDVGNDSNRAVDGVQLRRRFFDEYQDVNIDPRKSNELMSDDCSWFEMLIALSEALDYLYDEGVKHHYLDIIENLGLTKIIHMADSRFDDVDQELVDLATHRVDDNRFDKNGHGGLFPLHKRDHPDQREVEIWEQHAAYFRERLEGVVWTSTN